MTKARGVVLSSWSAAALLACGVTAGLDCARIPHNPRQPPLCAVDPEPPRIVRYLSSQETAGGPLVYGLVLEDQQGIPTRVFNLSAWQEDSGVGTREASEDFQYGPLFELARERWEAYREARRAGRIAQDPTWERFSEVIVPEKVCSPVGVSQAKIDSGERIILGAAFNYREHAEESGGGEVFLFPKPVHPTGPYRSVVRSESVVLLDYEVELGFVLLEDIDLAAVPSASDFEEKVAYFAANDVSDREPVLRRQPIIGTSTGYAESKGKPGFLPLGPWMVHGRELQVFSGDCSRSLRLMLEVKENGRRSLRQHSETARMLDSPRELLIALGAHLDPRERRSIWSAMSIFRGEKEWFYPLAQRVAQGGRARTVLPRGSILVTGTPAGVAFYAPNRLRLIGRSLIHLRSPVEQFIRELKEHHAQAGFLRDGDVVIASVEGLGVQRWAVEAEVFSSQSDPCMAEDAIQ